MGLVGISLTLTLPLVQGLMRCLGLAIGNYGLLSPQHLINPWTNGRVRVREIPTNSVQELRESRGILVNQMAKLNTQISEEIAIDVERWKQKRLKLGKKKSDEKVSVGDVI